MQYKDDYAKAGVPMLPVVADRKVVTKQIVLYSWLMVITTLVLPFFSELSVLYVICAVILGYLFLAEVYALKKRAFSDALDIKPMKLFHGSITYLALLFLIIGLDPLLNM
jgi:protoheme IX farnesyltransferase